MFRKKVLKNKIEKGKKLKTFSLRCRIKKFFIFFGFFSLYKNGSKVLYKKPKKWYKKKHVKTIKIFLKKEKQKASVCVIDIERFL